MTTRGIRTVTGLSIHVGDRFVCVDGDYIVTKVDEAAEVLTMRKVHVWSWTDTILAALILSAWAVEFIVWNHL